MQTLPLTCRTSRLGAPPTWDHAKSGLCHTIEIYEAGGWMTSAWRPSAAELKRLGAGAPLFLLVQGQVHPVLCMSVGRPEDVKGLESDPAIHSALPTLAQAIVDATAFDAGGGLQAALLDTLERETGFKVTR